MTLEECYARMSGNYEEVKQRMRKEALIDKYVRKFLDDPTFARYEDALERKDAHDVFMALHTLKGISQNLGMEALYDVVRTDCELFRHGWSEEGAQHGRHLKQVYVRTCDAIREYMR